MHKIDVHKISSGLIAAFYLSTTMAFAAPATSSSNPQGSPATSNVAAPPPAAPPTPTKKTATTTPFVNNHYVLTGSLKVNGYHPGDPTMVIVDKGSHSTYVLQLQNGQVTRVLTVSNAIGKEEKPTPPGRYFVLSKKQFSDLDTSKNHR